ICFGEWMMVAELVPCAIDRNVVRHKPVQPREALRLDLDSEPARPIAVILYRGLTPGRRIRRGNGFRLWPLDDAGSDHHLERGGDQAGPIGAGADGFHGPPLAVMHGCADNGERSGGGDGGSGHGGCHDALLSCCMSVAWSSSTTAPIRLAGAPLGERRSACPISAGRAPCWSNSESRTAASAANASNVEFCLVASTNTSPTAPSRK